jgi:fatty-acyl-CoA synthase
VTLAVDWVAANAARYLHADALEDADTGRRISWQQLENEVARTAGALAANFGIAAGARVAVLADNDVRFFVLQFATMRLGAIMVPLNWRLSLAELTILCKDCAPTLLVHDATHRESALAITAQLGVPGVEWGDEGQFDEFVRDAAALPDPALRTLTDPTHILYTSGTTGLPKGALVTAETLTWQTFNISDVDAVRGPGNRLLCPLPLFHAGGLNTLANPILIAGGCVSVLTRFDPAQCLELLGDPARGITHFGSVPTMYQMMSDLPAFGTADFSAIKHLQVAGGIASRSLLDTWAARGVHLQVHYGGTEMGPAITAMPREWVNAKVGSCGYPVPHTRVRIVTPEGTDAAVEEVGEVWIQGRSVTPGYFENPAATEASFVDGWFCTGDAARRDAEGFLYLVDRYKDMYKSGGENVFPAEVERILLEHPSIAEVTVIGVPDDKWGEVGVAVVVLRSGGVGGGGVGGGGIGGGIDTDEVARFCGDRLARYKLPKQVVVVGELPRNATGKIVKADLRNQYLSGALEPA